MPSIYLSKKQLEMARQATAQVQLDEALEEAVKAGVFTETQSVLISSEHSSWGIIPGPTYEKIRPFIKKKPKLRYNPLLKI